MATSDNSILLTEYGKRLTSELTATQAARLAQLPPEQLTVQLGPEPGTYRLTAGDRIGVILSEGVHIRIEPKVPIANLFYMLTYAEKLDWFRDQQAPLGRSEDLFAFIVQMFVNQVDRIVRQGIQRGYIDLEETHPYLRGRLLLGDHLRRTVVRPGLFHQRTNEFTADLPENRILHETLNRLGRAPRPRFAAPPAHSPRCVHLRRGALCRGQADRLRPGDLHAPERTLSPGRHAGAAAAAVPVAGVPHRPDALRHLPAAHAHYF